MNSRGWAISFTASPDEFQRLGPCCRVATPSEHPQNRVEYGVQFFAHILGKKAQHEIAVLLQQLVLPPIATIRDRIREVLSAVEFDGYARVGAQQVDLKCSEAVERDRQRHVDAEPSIRLPQRVQSSVEEGLRCTSCSRYTFGVFWHQPRGVHEQARQRCVDAVSNEPSHASGVVALPDGI